MQETVGQSRLPMIDVGNNAEIPDMCCVHCILQAKTPAWPD
jgi:hypothetical protein